MQIDLMTLPQGQTYEDRYSGYIEVFRNIAMTPPDEQVVVHNPPWSWIPLLHHLKCVCIAPRMVFKHCGVVRAAWKEPMTDRLTTEVLCSFRPETVDCLWKCDMQWKIPVGRVREYPVEREFIVTNNGSYHRPEVLEYLTKLRQYQPKKDKVLLVPCAADKPYPSPLHKACLEILPDDYYLMNATGVVGLVPQDLWDVMPWYDSGIPNQWRLMDIAMDYFKRFKHKRIVVYTDFYSQTIYRAMSLIGQVENCTFINGVDACDDYLDLLAPANFDELKSYFQLYEAPSRRSAEIAKDIPTD